MKLRSMHKMITNSNGVEASSMTALFAIVLVAAVVGFFVALFV